jgi:DNA-binding NarL/FixJ family response regulator
MTRIVIVEDDEDFSIILKRALEQEPDLEVIEVIKSEQEALARIKSTKFADCDCVLLDLQLPYLPGERSVNSLAGLHILEELRQGQHYFGTIIVLTNSKAPQDGQRALSGGCDGYLCKRARIAEIPAMLAELKMAIRGEVFLISSQMRHVFVREDISAKEARLMDLLCAGKSWVEIARDLNYKTSKAAANIGDRIFDKLLTPQDQQILTAEGLKKRHRAVEIWKSRHPNPTHV